MRPVGKYSPMKRLTGLPSVAAHFHVYVRLRSTDLARARSDTLTWQPALLGGGALVRCWGRTGGAERTRADHYPDRAGSWTGPHDT